MSHHFDYTADERLDISDAYCFAGPSDAFGPRTVFGMNASPNSAGPWDPAGTGRYIVRRTSPAGAAYALMITGRANPTSPGAT